MHYLLFSVYNTGDMSRERQIGHCLELGANVFPRKRTKNGSRKCVGVWCDELVALRAISFRPSDSAGDFNMLKKK